MTASCGVSSDSHDPRGRRTILRVLSVQWAIPLLDPASSGPMTVLLIRMGEERGSITWQAVYGNPLGQLPEASKPRGNRYLSACDKLYSRHARSGKPRP